jgi:uncharacterized membrane protein YgcG
MEHLVRRHLGDGTPCSQQQHVYRHSLNAWLWVASHSARDLTFPLMLLTSTNVVAATAIFLRRDFLDLPAAAALSTMIMLGLVAAVIPAQIYIMRRTVGGSRRSWGRNDVPHYRRRERHQPRHRAEAGRERREERHHRHVRRGRSGGGTQSGRGGSGGNFRRP